MNLARMAAISAIMGATGRPLLAGTPLRREELTPSPESVKVRAATLRAAEEKRNRRAAGRLGLVECPVCLGACLTENPGEPGPNLCPRCGLPCPVCGASPLPGWLPPGTVPR